VISTHQSPGRLCAPIRFSALHERDDSPTRGVCAGSTGRPEDRRDFGMRDLAKITRRIRTTYGYSYCRRGVLQIAVLQCEGEDEVKEMLLHYVRFSDLCTVCMVMSWKCKHKCRPGIMDAQYRWIDRDGIICVEKMLRR
jgi:hypothetical protein